MTAPIVRSADEAALLATALSRLIEGGLVNGPSRDLLRSIRDRCRADGPAITSAPGSEGGAVPDDEFVDVETAATLLAITPRAVRMRCDSGRIPARKIANVWLIPAHVLPIPPEAEDDQHAA